VFPCKTVDNKFKMGGINNKAKLVLKYFNKSFEKNIKMRQVPGIRFLDNVQVKKTRNNKDNLLFFSK
tara:strand:+ start:168 stop:368 length:201 start_codon:yes stop_codon:yes gene_type:complete